MASRNNKTSHRRPQGPRPGSPAVKANGPRRLGDEERHRPPARNVNRYQRQKQERRRKMAWFSVVAVVLAVAIFAIVALTGSSAPKTSTASKAGSGDHPAPMPASVVQLMTTIPASTFNAIGAGSASDTQPFTVTSGQPALKSGSKPLFVFVGAEYCPYCAVMRWALVEALSRFGTFSGLKQTASDNAEYNIPSFSFLGSSYKSPYLVFNPYEIEDRNQNPLQTPPQKVIDLYSTYDGTLDGSSGTKFDNNTPGIPFLDIANKYVSAGDDDWLSNIAPTFANGGPGASITSMAQAIATPLSSTGKNLNTAVVTAEANYISAAICNVDGGKPISVCNSPGVKAAMAKVAATKPIS